MSLYEGKYFDHKYLVKTQDRDAWPFALEIAHDRARATGQRWRVWLYKSPVTPGVFWAVGPA